ncbi:DUF3107 domain-containing protein [Bifidobacterium gallicum]|uniref:ATP-binding protein n=1 Tax=Bifidobacterium gallicum DSM 20093 = LMG 11596 TaxID=561180 RepID=D1NSP0_9BIFI|nr:DUF3107 domain-containing protein [Bifidobacterium gallicum]EFA23692.1 hypothetical protein BIFGAL_02799 [Bifidobacterium gallicum DSM 20093 = LMG 11596]KFI59282.1 ATP-binding protein [Bifidobacterium gallicum DSM 20093 = LMG 11596]
MEIEIGIQNVARAVTFTTDATEQEVSETINAALAAHEPIVLRDNNGRTFIVPTDSLAYVIIGSQTKHVVGFGNL